MGYSRSVTGHECCIEGYKSTVSRYNCSVTDMSSFSDTIYGSDLSSGIVSLCLCVFLFIFFHQAMQGIIHRNYSKVCFRAEHNDPALTLRERKSQKLNTRTLWVTPRQSYTTPAYFHVFSVGINCSVNLSANSDKTQQLENKTKWKTLLRNKRFLSFWISKAVGFQTTQLVKQDVDY